MSYSHKTKAQLIQEIEALQEQVAALEPLETTIQQSSEAFRQFMERSSDGFVLLDETGTIIEWNEGQARITGIPNNEALGKKNWETLFELVAEDSKTPENYELYKKRTLDILETGQADWMRQPLERTIHRPDGEQRIIQSAAFSIPTRKGFQIGIVTRDITRRRHTEEALHESEIRQKTILDNAIAMIYIKDLQGRYIEINHHCEQILGVSNAEAQGKTPHDIYPESIADMFMTNHRKVIETGQPFEVEEVFELDSGSFTFLAVHFPLRDANGEVYATCGISSNITERKKNEEIRHIAEEQLRQAVKAGNVGLWDWNIKDNSVYFSPEWKRQIGYEDHEIENKFDEWQSRVHPEDLDHALQTIRAFIDAPYPNYQNEFRFRHKDGEYRWILAQADLMYDENDKPVRMLGSHIDITERKRVQEALRESERLAQAIANTTPSILYIYDTVENQNVWVNATHREIFGNIFEKDASNLSQKVTDASMNPEGLTALVERTSKLQAGNDGEWLDVEYRMMTTDGQLHWFHDRASVFERDESGKVTKIIGSAIDITERKQAEEALKRSEREKSIILDSLSEAVVYQDLEHNVVWLNREAREGTDIPHHEIIGKRCYEVWHGEKQACDGCPIEKVWETRKPAESEVTNPNGRTRLLRGNPVFDEQGKLIGIVEVGLDITERKQAEEALRKSEARLTDAQAIAQIGSFELHPTDPSRYYWSKSLYDILGFDPDQPPPDLDVYASRIHPDDRAGVEKLIKQAFEDGTSPTTNYRYLLPDGQVKNIHARAWVTFDDQGKPEMLIGTAQDVTEFKQTENELLKYKHIVSVTNDLLALTNTDYEYQAVSDSYLTFFDCTREQVLGQTAASLIGEELFETKLRHRYEQCLKGEVVQFQDWYDMPGRGRRYMDAVYHPFYGSQGTVEGVVISIRDNTELRKAEEALRKSETRLSEAQTMGQIGSFEQHITEGPTYWSKELYHILGFDPDQPPPAYEEFTSRIHPDDQAHVNENTERAFKEGSEIINHFRYLIPGGLVKNIYTRAQIVRDDQGQPELLIGTCQDVTEFKQAERALQENQRYLSRLMCNLPGAAYRMKNNRAWTAEFLSEGIQDLTGYPPDDFLGDKKRDYADLIHPDDQDAVWDNTQKALKKCEPFEITYRILTADGQEKWVWERGQGVFGDDGEVLTLEGFITDITELKQTEQALRESETRYRTLVEFSPIAISILGGEESYLYVNPAWEQLTGYSLEDSKTMRPIDLVHPDMAHLVKGRGEARLRGEKVPSRYELKTVTKDGVIKWSDFSVALITFEGEPAILAIANDITDRMQAEEALRRERDKAQTYLDIVDVIVVAINSEQQVTLINQKGCELLGYSEGEIIGKNWFDTFIPEADQEKLRDHFVQIIAGQVEAFDLLENTIVNRDGKERLIAWRSSVLKDEDGRIIGTLSSGDDITERRRSEQALLESEERYRSLVEFAPTTISIMDRVNNRYLYVNPAWEQLTGYSLEDADTMHPIDLIHPDMRQMVTERSTARLQGESVPSRYEAKILTKDGKTKWLDLGATMVTIEDQPAILTIANDITDRMQAEEALRQERDKAQTYLDIVNVIMVAINSDQQVTLINQRGCELLGYTEEEIIGKNWFSTFIPEEDQEGAKTVFSQLIAGEIELTEYYENAIVNKAGEEQLIAWRNTVLRNEDGDIIGTLSSGDDITERRRAEQALRESEARYRTLFEQANDAILIENEDDQILDVNQQACDLLGYTKEELLSMTVPQLQAPQCRGTAGQVIKNELKQYKGQPFETVDLHRDGRLIPVEVTTSHLTGLEDGLAISIVRDITRRKEAEKELRQSLDLLNSTQRLAKVGGWEWDIDSQTMFWTEETYRLHGVDSSLSGFDKIEYSLSCYAPEDRPLVETAFRRCVNEGEKFDHEFLFTTARDGQRWIRVTAEPIKQDDKIIRVIGNMADITERKRVEQAEREQRILAEALADTASALSSTLDLNEVFDRILDNVGRVVAHDAAQVLLIEDDACRMIRTRGYDTPQLKKIVQNLVFNVSDTPNLKQMIETQKPMVIDDVRHYHGWIPTPRLEQFHSYIGTPICVGGEVLGFLTLFALEPGSFTEQYTRRIQAFADQAAIAIQNAQLFEAERRERALAQTFQNVSAGLNSPVSMINTLDQITGSLAEALGYERVALLLTDGDLLSMVTARGIDLTDLTQKRTFSYPEITALYLSMASGDPLIISVDDKPGANEVLLPAFDPDSTRGWIGMPLVVAEVVIGYLCVSTSKSVALKSRDLEVVKAFAQQAEFVIGNSLILDELAVSLTNLHETRERLSRAARLSVAGEIAAGVAHQINNPLTTVVAQVYLLMKKLPTDHPGFKHAESIKQAAYRAGSVVQRMLDFGRPTPFIRKPLDVNESLETAISLVRAQIEPHIAQIKVELAPDLPPVKGSSQHLEDVWLNLLLNARDALTSRDHGIIGVTTRLDTHNNTVTIIIEDNGPGISPEDLIKVFDPFFTTKSHGTGLGLAICQDVIVKHNGTIDVESVDDRGTIFTINLPV